MLTFPSYSKQCLTHLCESRSTWLPIPPLASSHRHREGRFKGFTSNGSSSTPIFTLHSRIHAKLCKSHIATIYQATPLSRSPQYLFSYAPLANLIITYLLLCCVVRPEGISMKFHFMANLQFWVTGTLAVCIRHHRKGIRRYLLGYLHPPIPFESHPLTECSHP